MITLARRFWRHLRPSPAEVARDEELLVALSESAADDPDGYDRVVFLASSGDGA